MEGSHPLLQWFLDAADGRFPPAGGGVTFLPPVEDGREAIVAFTGHAVIASRLGEDDLADLAPDGFGGAMAPEVQLRLAGTSSAGIGGHDVVLVARGTGAGSGVPRTDRWDDHPRVRHARAIRRQVEVHGDDRGFFTLANGLAGRRETSIELVDGARGAGAGRTMIAAALAAMPEGEPLFAAVAPGNARSLRAFLSAGFTPVASEVIITPTP